jgi:hypothetical protein
MLNAISAGKKNPHSFPLPNASSVGLERSKSVLLSRYLKKTGSDEGLTLWDFRRGWVTFLACP